MDKKTISQFEKKFEGWRTALYKQESYLRICEKTITSWLAYDHGDINGNVLEEMEGVNLLIEAIKKDIRDIAVDIDGSILEVRSASNY